MIYFSGQGTSANDNNNAYDLPYATGAWVPYDLDYATAATVSKSLIVGRRDLLPLLRQLDEGGRWVVVVSDSCYSGQVGRRSIRQLLFRPGGAQLRQIAQPFPLPARARA